MTTNNNNNKLADGVSLNATDGYGFTSDWVDVLDASIINVSATFTGGSPTGNLFMEQSNDLQWTGKGKSRPRLAVSGTDNSAGATKIVSDVAPVSPGHGTANIAVSGTSTKYLLDQYQVGYRWFRVVYTPSGNANTQLDIFFNTKKA